MAEVKLASTGLLVKMLHEHMFEHIARYGVDIVQLSIVANNFDHASLNLITFATFVVQTMHIERGTSGDREGCNGFFHGSVLLIIFSNATKQLTNVILRWLQRQPIEEYLSSCCRHS